MIKHELIINADLDKAWQVLGPGYAAIDQWASAVKQSEAKDTQSLNGSVCMERSCQVTGLGNVLAKLTEYSETNHMLVYQVVKGMPGIVKYAACTWSLANIGNGQISLVVRFEFKTGGLLGGLMKGLVRNNTSKLYAGAAEEFKHYLESGAPHPRKEYT
jgi:hypothetical protein